MNTPEETIVTPSGVSPLREGRYLKCALGHTISSYSMELNFILLTFKYIYSF